MPLVQSEPLLSQLSASHLDGKRPNMRVVAAGSILPDGVAFTDQLRADGLPLVQMVLSAPRQPNCVEIASDITINVLANDTRTACSAARFFSAPTAAAYAILTAPICSSGFCPA